MGFKKFIKKAGKAVKKVATLPIKTAKKVIGGFSGKDDGGGDDGAELDARAAAAAKSIKTVNKQAGSGQIEYQTEE